MVADLIPKLQKCGKLLPLSLFFTFSSFLQLTKKVIIGQTFKIIFFFFETWILLVFFLQEQNPNQTFTMHVFFLLFYSLYSLLYQSSILLLNVVSLFTLKELVAPTFKQFPFLSFNVLINNVHTEKQIMHSILIYLSLALVCFKSLRRTARSVFVFIQLLYMPF